MFNVRKGEDTSIEYRIEEVNYVSSLERSDLNITNAKSLQHEFEINLLLRPMVSSNSSCMHTELYLSTRSEQRL
jgi:hypothetical protein